MKNTLFTLIAIIVCVFLYVSCEQSGLSEADTEKAVNETSTTAGFANNNNEQGEDEGNGKNPPLVFPPDNNDEQGEDTGNDEPIEVANLLEKYDISMNAGIWRTTGDFS